MTPPASACRVNGSRVARSRAEGTIRSADRRDSASATATSSAQNLSHPAGAPPRVAASRRVAAGRRAASSATAASRPAAAHASVFAHPASTPISSSSSRLAYPPVPAVAASSAPARDGPGALVSNVCPEVNPDPARPCWPGTGSRGRNPASRPGPARRRARLTGHHRRIIRPRLLEVLGRHESPPPGGGHPGTPTPAGRHPRPGPRRPLRNGPGPSAPPPGCPPGPTGYGLVIPAERPPGAPGRGASSPRCPSPGNGSPAMLPAPLDGYHHIATAYRTQYRMARCSGGGSGRLSGPSARLERGRAGWGTTGRRAKRKGREGGRKEGRKEGRGKGGREHARTAPAE